MFETRDYRVSFFVSLVLSAIVHLALLWFIRVDIGVGNRDFWRSVTEMRKLLFIPSGKRVTHLQREMVFVEVPEELEEHEVILPPPMEEVEETKPVEVITGEKTEGESEYVNPFEPDSLDLLLTYPWMFPAEEDQAKTLRLTGLERALRRLRALELERRTGQELTLDTKYGKFGVSSRGLLLGPIVIPLPLAPYTSSEMRDEERSYEEIKSQSLREIMKDQDLEQQRERIIEWKRRKEGGA